MDEVCEEGLFTVIDGDVKYMKAVWKFSRLASSNERQSRALFVFVLAEVEVNSNGSTIDKR